MAREKPNYRDMLSWLFDKYGNMSFCKRETAEILQISRPFLDKLIREGKINAKGNYITIGSLASYLCD